MADFTSRSTVRRPWPLRTWGTSRAAHSRWWLGTDTLGANLALRKPGVQLSGEQLSPSRMATDGQRIYGSTVDGLRMFTIADSTLTELIPTATTIGTRFNGVAVDAAGALYHIYWGTSDGSIWRLRKP